MKRQILQFAKQFVPPIIWNVVRRLVLGEPKTHAYSGSFATFDEVARAYPAATNYHSAQSESSEIEEGRERLAKLEGGDVPEFGTSLSRLNFLPVALCFFPGETVSVLDVGGGLGVSYVQTKFALPTKRIKMTVVELPQIAVAGRQLFSNYPDVEFASEIPSNGDSGFDLVYFGSSLQYFENYADVLRQVASLTPEYIVIADTTAGPAESFVCAQINMAGRVIPRMVFNLTELVDILAALGFRKVHQSASRAPDSNFDNFDPPVNRTAHWTLVFRRQSG